MPFHIKKPVALGSGDVYYESGSTWTQTYADSKVYSSKSTADAQIVNTNGDNGGFVGATVVSE